MELRLKRRGLFALGAVAVLGAACLGLPAAAAPQGYKPINPTMANKTITLTGKDLTIEQVIQVARYGAKVQLSPEAKQRESDNYGLLLQAPTEGVSVYWFTRGAGPAREVVMFEGDPMTPKNKEYLEKKMLATFEAGGLPGYGPELDEELVRAIMVVRANAMTWNAPSPDLSQMLQDFLNKRVSPVMWLRGSVGEGDLITLGKIGGVMVGKGEAYVNGVRMSGADALKKAGLKTLKPFAADDNALTSSNALATAMAAIAVNDGREALEWADVIYTMNLNGMNSSIETLSYLVQSDRPFPWLNWHANRSLEMLKGSYLFDGSKRIIQDPISLRASSIRQASAWQDWGTLRDTVVIQLNSSDHNPAIRSGLSPQDSWDLATPEMMKYYVKGGKYTNGKGGFIFSNANWDPYPLANHLEAFTIAMANMDIGLFLRPTRFSQVFTDMSDDDVRKLMGKDFFFFGGGGFSNPEVYQEIQSLIAPVTPEGYGTVEDFEAQTRIKAERSNRVVDETFRLLASDIVNAANWMDIRKAQDPKREFGPAPTAALAAFRKVMPLKSDMASLMEMFSGGGARVNNFLRTTPASTFFSDNSGGNGPSPVAQANLVKKASR